MTKQTEELQKEKDSFNYIDKGGGSSYTARYINNQLIALSKRLDQEQDLHNDALKYSNELAERIISLNDNLIKALKHIEDLTNRVYKLEDNK